MRDRKQKRIITVFIALVALVSTYLPHLPILPAQKVFAQTPNTEVEAKPVAKPPVSGSFIDYYAEERQLKGHEGSVNSANFSPNGKLIVTAGVDKTARIWDFSGQELQVLRGHEGSVRSANFSPNGQLIVTASFDGTARVWDNSGKELVSLKGHEGKLFSANFSPDGQRIVTAGVDGVRLWDTSGKQLGEIKGHLGSVYSANFSPDGKLIVTAGADKTARIWDSSGKFLTELKGHTDTVWSANFSPDSQQVVTASEDKTARVWDLSGKELVLSGHEDTVWSANFSPDGKRIITASVDFTGLIWEAPGKLVGKLQKHTGGVNSANFSKDGRWIVTASNDGTARVWNPQSKVLTELQGHRAKLSNASFSPNGKLVLTSDDDGLARLWDISTKNLLVEFEQKNNRITARFSPDGKMILTSSTLSLHVWDTSGNLLTKIINYDDYFPQPAIFSPDGKVILANSGRYNNKVLRWDISGKQLGDIEGHLNYSSFNSVPQLIITASPEGKTNISDLFGKQLTELKIAKVESAHLSSDGKFIITTSNDKTARVWDISGRQVAELKGHQGNVASISSNGQHIVTSAFSDENTRLWDFSGNLLATFKGGMAVDVAFSPDGKRIFTESNKTVRIWDLSGKLTGELKGHQGNITSINFSFDGQQVITASDDYTARIWYLFPKYLPEQNIPETPFSNKIQSSSTTRITNAYISFSRSGQLVAIFSDYGIARVWDVSGKLLAELRGVTNSVDFSPDERLIITSDYDFNRLWDISGKLIAQFEGGGKAKFSLDGQRIITNSWKGFARVWDISGKLIAQFEGEEINFSPDGQRIVTTFKDNAPRVWDISGMLISELKGHSGTVTSASFSPDGQQIVTTSDDKTACVWSTSGKLLAILKGHESSVKGASFSPNSKQIITTSTDGDNNSFESRTVAIRVWDADGKLRSEFKQLKERFEASDSFSPDSQKTLTISNDDTIDIWNLSGKKVLSIASTDSKIYVNDMGKALLRSVKFSPDGKLILAVYNGDSVLLWNSSGEFVAELKGGLNNNASFSPDGNKIITVSQDTTARVWDLSGKLTATLREGTEVQVADASFSPDGQMVVAVMENNTPRLWDVSGKFRAELQGHKFWIGSATFSPDSKLIVTRSDDSVRIWDTSGKELAILEGSKEALTSVSFTPDGKKVIALTDNNTSYIWDTSGKLISKTEGNLESFNPDEKLVVTEAKNNDVGSVRISNTSGELIAELRGHRAVINTARLSRDCKLIVTSSDDGTAHVWDISGKQLAVLHLPFPPSSPKVEADRLRDLQFYAPNCALAIQPWLKALKLYQDISDSENQVVILEQLGNAHYCLGDYTSAIQSYTQASTIAQKFNYSQLQAKNILYLGHVYNTLADYETAINKYDVALKLLSQENYLIKADILRGRANTYYFQGKYKEAIQDYLQALPIYKAVDNVFGEAEIKISLASIYLISGDVNTAIQYYKEALDTKPIEALVGLGDVYLRLDDINQAIDYYQQSLAKAKQQEDKEGEGNALNKLGFVLYKSDNLDDAEERIRLAIKILEELRVNLDDTNKISIFEKQTRAYRLLQQILIAQNQPEKALEISESGRARAFVELLSQRLSPNPKEESKITPPDLNQIKQIADSQNATIVQYSIIYDESTNESKAQKQESKLYIWVVKPNDEKIDFKEVNLKKYLQEDEINLEELVNNSRQSFGVYRNASRTTTPVTNTPGKRDQFLITINPELEKENLTEYLQKLHEILIAPIAQFLPKDETQRVIFVPQGELFLVPFPALIDETGKHLIEKHTILTAPSIQVLELTRKAKEDKKQINSGKHLVVGNPTMPDASLKSLEGAEAEAKAISSPTLLNTKPLIGKAATETEVVAKMPQAKIIHLATHGLFDDLRGLGSAIALAPSGKDDGLLTAEEILNFKQKLNADLVVLSACDTGRGRITGDGVIGLSRAFISAGVPSVVVSLWAVPDGETAFLMEKFYENWLQNIDKPNKATALRNAMLKTKQKYPNPRQWAAFTLIGEAE